MFDCVSQSFTSPRRVTLRDRCRRRRLSVDIWRLRRTDFIRQIRLSAAVTFRTARARSHRHLCINTSGYYLVAWCNAGVRGVSIFQRCRLGRQELETRWVRDCHQLLTVEIPWFTLELDDLPPILNANNEIFHSIKSYCVTVLYCYSHPRKEEIILLISLAPITREEMQRMISCIFSQCSVHRG